MEKSHLVSLLRTFDKKEVRELKKWVDSPAHNQRQDVRDLLDHLTTGQRLLTGRHLEKERVFASLFPGQPYHDAEMRQVMFFLFKATEDFLIFHEVQKDEVRAQTMLAKVYRERQLAKLFLKTIETGQKIQQAQRYRNHQFFENEYVIQLEQYSYLSGLNRTVALNLQEVSDAHDLAYLANKLQLSCIMYSHQKVFKADYRMNLLETLLEEIEENPAYLNVPAIAIYYFQFKAITQPENESYYRQLKTEIIAHGSLFPAQEIRVIYLLTINYCIGRINAGKTEFDWETFELYQQGLEQEIFLENGVLSRFTFGNVVLIGLELKEFDWVENFIRQYQQFLEEKHRAALVQFHTARLYFEKKNYVAAMPLFAQLEYDDILITLTAKTNLLRMYYELDEFNALDSLIESMGAYLKRKKVTGYHKSNYQNILRFTKKLLRTTPYDKAQLDKLRHEIEAADPLTERKWLLAQVERL